MGSARVAIHAGAMPKTTPVISDTANANSSTGTDGEALMGTLPCPAEVGKATCKITARAGESDGEASRPAHEREQDALDEWLPHQPGGARAQRHA